MEISFEKYGFYMIDIDYVKYLYSKDTEVFYSEEIGYDKKPYLGIIANLNNFHYCIPLTSPKPKQLNWKNISEQNYLIYENVEDSELHKSDICKKIGEIKKNDSKVSIYKKLLAVLDIKKMIPVSKSLYSRIDFSKLSDLNYRALLQKEYNFLLPHKNKILEKANKLYVEQKTTGIIKDFYCTFSILETALMDYISQNQIENDTKTNGEPLPLNEERK